MDDLAVCYASPTVPCRCMPVTPQARRDVVAAVITEYFDDCSVDDGLCGDVAGVLLEAFPDELVLSTEPQPNGLGSGGWPMHTWVIDRVTLLSHDLQNPHGVHVKDMAYWGTCESRPPSYEDVQADMDQIGWLLRAGLTTDRVRIAYEGRST